MTISNEDGELGLVELITRIHVQLAFDGPDVDVGALNEFISGDLVNPTSRQLISRAVMTWRNWHEAYWWLKLASDAEADELAAVTTSTTRPSEVNLEIPGHMTYRLLHAELRRRLSRRSSRSTMEARRNVLEELWQELAEGLEPSTEHYWWFVDVGSRATLAICEEMTQAELKETVSGRGDETNLDVIRDVQRFLNWLSAFHEFAREISEQDAALVRLHEFAGRTIEELSQWTGESEQRIADRLAVSRNTLVIMSR